LGRYDFAYGIVSPQRLFAIDGTLLCRDVVAENIPDIMLVNGPQPRHELVRLVAIESLDSAKNGQARLLNNIRLVQTAYESLADYPPREQLQIRAMMFEQVSQRIPITVASTTNQRTDACRGSCHLEAKIRFQQIKPETVRT